MKIDSHGNRYHEPPYTKAEEDELYRALAAAQLLSRVQPVTKRLIKRAQKSARIERDPDPLRQRHKKGGEAPEVFIENHRYLIWFSREVDTHSHTLTTSRL